MTHKSSNFSYFHNPQLILHTCGFCLKNCEKLDSLPHIKTIILNQQIDVVTFLYLDGGVTDLKLFQFIWNLFSNPIMIRINQHNPSVYLTNVISASHSVIADHLFHVVFSDSNSNMDAIYSVVKSERKLAAHPSSGHSERRNVICFGKEIATKCCTIVFVIQ